MMSSFFKNLTRGVKFNTDRFLDDAVKLQILKQSEATASLTLPTQIHTGYNKQAAGVKRNYNIVGEDGISISIFKKKKINESKGDGSYQPIKIRNAQQNEEKMKNIRKSHAIHVWGFDIPDPIQEFCVIPTITEQILTNIGNCGYIIPTPVQMQAIPIILQKRELLAFSATGSGKSAAFLIPIIILLKKAENSGARAVILSPTRELAAQIHRECLRLAVGTGLRSFNLAKKNCSNQKLNAKHDILISTPNRLVYSIKQDEINMKCVKLLVIDECDNLFEDGFQDQIGSIYSACDSGEIKRAFFSATCAYKVEQFCNAHLDSHIVVSIGSKNAAVDLVEQAVVFTGTESGKLSALKEHVRKGVQAPILVFVQSQERADELFSELTHEGINCGVIHSGKTESQRERVVESFRLGKIWMLICTAILSRGIDFSAVRSVVNYDMPTSAVQYIHCIGRTGRAGRLGKAITFFTESDKDNLRRLAQVLKNSGFPVPAYLLTLKKPRKDQIHVPKREHISRRPKLVTKIKRNRSTATKKKSKDKIIEINN